MNLYGVPQPIYRAMQMVRALGSRLADVHGQHATVAVWVGLGDDAAPGATEIVLINQALPRHAIAAEPVRLKIRAPIDRRPVSAVLLRIDDEHANPEKAWREMGAPDYPSPAQVDTLTAALLPVAEPMRFECTPDGTLLIELTLAPQSVNRISVEWRAAA